MIGEIINKLRKQKELSQSELGKELCLSASAIGMYEQNRRLPDIDATVKLSEFFSVSVDYLLELSDVKTPYAKSACNDTVQKRITALIKFNDKDIDYVASVSNIRKRRLLDIIDENKSPDINEIRSLSLCFNESSDYILGITDVKHKDNQSRDKGYYFFFFFDDKDLQEVFVSALKTALETQDMTVSELCEKTEIDVDTCNQYLTGEHAPTLEHLVELSKALDVSIDYLLGQVPKISQAEKKLLNAFENLSEDNQDIIIGKTKELLREQRFDNPPVAADGNRKAVGK